MKRNLILWQKIEGKHVDIAESIVRNIIKNNQEILENKDQYFLKRIFGLITSVVVTYGLIANVNRNRLFGLHLIVSGGNYTILV